MTWPRGHQYQRSPLSPGVPLEGSDTVQGLRQIDHLRRTEMLKQSLGVPGGGHHAPCTSPVPALRAIPSRWMIAPAGNRQQYERYKGPYLSQLTAEHLQQQPRPWPEFIYASRTGARDMAYNVPSHTRMLWERMEENMVYFLVCCPSRCGLCKLPSVHIPVRTRSSYLLSKRCCAGKLLHDSSGVWGAPHVSSSAVYHDKTWSCHVLWERYRMC